MKEKKFRSIKSKLVLLLSANALVVLILFALAVFLYTVDNERKSGIQSLSQTTEIMALNLMAAIEFDDKESAEHMLHTLSLNENIEGAFVFDPENEVLASYLLNRGKEEKLLATISNVFNKSEDLKSIKYIDSQYIVICNDVTSEQEHIATLCIISNTDKLNDTLKEQFFVFLIVFILSMIIVVILGLRTQKNFTRPIFQMKDAMEDIVLNSTYDVKIKAQSNDEFKILFDGFNHMIEQIKDQKSKLEEVNKHTRESIEYAALIQSALIPDNNAFRKYFKDYFAIWHPKDLVGGDIYLFEELRHDDECLLMVIDCTGHGVPGAFVTMLVKAIERQIVAKIKHSDEVVNPAKILSIFNNSMKHLLKQEDSSSISNSGFDGQILYYNKKENILKVASARNEVFYFQDDTLHVIKGDRHSVGYKDSNKDYAFTEHIIDTTKETTVYVSSDGFWDQNGGPKELPFGKKRLKKILHEIYKEKMADQQEEFLYTFEEYRNGHEVNDDVTIIGLKI